jgi:hypothetical protein
MNAVVCKIFILFSIISLFNYCKGPQTPKKIEASKNKESSVASYKKPASSFSDTLVISNTAAVFFNPDSSQLGRIKKVLKKDEYETEVHNCFYLMRNARWVIKQYWPRVHILEISKVRYLLFVKADKSKILIDLNTKNDMCGIFLFNRKKDPELIDMMNIDTALEFYFGK